MLPIVDLRSPPIVITIGRLHVQTTLWDILLRCNDTLVFMIFVEAKRTEPRTENQFGRTKPNQKKLQTTTLTEAPACSHDKRWASVFIHDKLPLHSLTYFHTSRLVAQLLFNFFFQWSNPSKIYANFELERLVKLHIFSTYASFLQNNAILAQEFTWILRRYTDSAVELRGFSGGGIEYCENNFHLRDFNLREVFQERIHHWIEEMFLGIRSNWPNSRNSVNFSKLFGIGAVWFKAWQTRFQTANQNIKVFPLGKEK